MGKYYQVISSFEKRNSSYTVVGSTFDEDAEKNIPWEYEVDSKGALVNSSSPYLQKLYGATKIDECIKDYIKELSTPEEKFKSKFNKNSYRFSYDVDENGTIKRLGKKNGSQYVEFYSNEDFDE